MTMRPGNETEPVEIVPVTGPREEELFWKVPYVIYRDDPAWYPPLPEDVKSIFDPRTNPAFRQGARACRWIARDPRTGELLGRIAAFIHPAYQHSVQIPAGGFGFFESVPSETVAHSLLRTAEHWLRQNQMIAIDGPINFGERNRWWGLLVENFSEPTYGMAYARPYYRRLIESAGYRPLYRQITYVRETSTPLPEHFRRRAEKYLKDPRFSFEHFSWKDKDRYLHALVEIYRRAWASRKDARQITVNEVDAEFRKYRLIIDPILLWFAFREETPLAFFIMFPDITPAVRKMWGRRLTFWNRLRFLWYLKRYRSRKILAILYGVVPEYQRTGLLQALVESAYRVVVPSRRYDLLEMYWIGDFNPVMHRVVSAYSGKPSRVHITYRKMLDPSHPWIPYRI